MALHSPVIVSSPPRQEIFLCSSSPNSLPSLESLLKKKPSTVLKAGSRAAPIPTGAASGFQSARLLQRSIAEDDVLEDTSKNVEKPRKRRKKSDDGIGTKTVVDQEKAPLPHDPGQTRRSPKLGRYLLEATEAIEEIHAVSPSRRVEKHLKKVDENQRALETGLHRSIDMNIKPLESTAKRKKPVAKPKAESKYEKITAATETPVPGPYQTITGEAQTSASCQDRLGYRQTQGLTRDGSAEPRAWTRPPNAIQDEPAEEHKTHEEGAPAALLSLDFHAAWSFTGPGSTLEDIKSKADAAPATHLKPKDFARPAKPSPEKKAKAPSKSSRTVTSVAIARYRDVANDDTHSDTNSFWDQSETARAMKLLEPGAASKAKSKAKTKPPPKKLPGPEAAQAKVERQEFFFGTSSQLTRDEPAEHVRDLQKAIKASEDNEDVPVLEGHLDGDTGLWGVGARGDESSLLEAEATARRLKTYSPKRNAFVDIDSIDASACKPKLKPMPSSSKGILHSISLNILSPVKTSPSKTSPSKASNRSFATKAGETVDPEIEPQKKPRGRPRKDASALFSSPKKVSRAKKIDTPADGDTAKRPRKRKAKEEQTEEQAEDHQAHGIASIDDIEEDGKHITATSTKGRKPKLSQKQLRDDFVANTAPALFPAITSVVKSQEQDRANPKSLTWYEKMLLYDPIVLEDLTAWLKLSALKEQEEKLMPMEELKPWMVQLWCEEHSVCCLWREGLRGGVKLKY